MHPKSMIILVLSCLAMASATPTQDARSIFEKANRACGALQTLKYTVETDFGPIKNTATYTEKRIPGAPPQTRGAVFQVEGESRDGTGSVQPFEYAFDGRTLDIRGEGDSVRTYENPDDYFMGQHLGMNLIGQMPFFGHTFVPNKDLKIRYIGRERIGKWNCQVVETERKLVHPEFGERISVARWAFDEVTNLPIRMKIGSITNTITSLTINPTLPPDTFRLAGKRVRGTKQTPQTQKLLDIGSIAPNFTLKDGSGKTRSLKEFRGKVVLIDFWGTWCTPCRQSMPMLQALYAKYGLKGFVVLGISVADKEMDPVAYMKRQKFTYQLMVNGDPVAKTYKAVMLPTMYLLDRNGKIVFRQAGIDRNDKTRLIDLIEGLVKK